MTINEKALKNIRNIGKNNHLTYFFTNDYGGHMWKKCMSGKLMILLSAERISGLILVIQ